jgi:hypothetical protein
MTLNPHTSPKCSCHLHAPSQKGNPQGPFEGMEIDSLSQSEDLENGETKRIIRDWSWMNGDSYTKKSPECSKKDSESSPTLCASNFPEIHSLLYNARYSLLVTEFFEVLFRGATGNGNGHGHELGSLLESNAMDSEESFYSVRKSQDSLLISLSCFSAPFVFQLMHFSNESSSSSSSSSPSSSSSTSSSASSFRVTDDDFGPISTDKEKHIFVSEEIASLERCKLCYILAHHQMKEVQLSFVLKLFSTLFLLVD